MIKMNVVEIEGKQEFPVRTARSPRATGPTNEQLKEQQRVRQMRSQMSERKEFDSSLPLELSGDAEDKWREREPNLTGITSEFDLELFRASQAEASFKYVRRFVKSHEECERVQISWFILKDPCRFFPVMSFESHQL